MPILTWEVRIDAVENFQRPLQPSRKQQHCSKTSTLTHIPNVVQLVTALVIVEPRPSFLHRYLERCTNVRKLDFVDALKITPFPLPPLRLPHATELVFRGPQEPLASLVAFVAILAPVCANIERIDGGEVEEPCAEQVVRLSSVCPKLLVLRLRVALRHREEMQAAAVRLPFVRLAVRYDLSS